MPNDNRAVVADTICSELAGYRVGDLVRLPCIDSPLEVVDFDPPSLLVLRAPSGRELRAGWRAVTRDTTTTA